MSGYLQSLGAELRTAPPPPTRGFAAALTAGAERRGDRRGQAGIPVPGRDRARCEHRRHRGGIRQIGCRGDVGAVRRPRLRRQPRAPDRGPGQLSAPGAGQRLHALPRSGRRPAHGRRRRDPGDPRHGQRLRGATTDRPRRAAWDGHAGRGARRLGVRTRGRSRGRGDRSQRPRPGDDGDRHHASARADRLPAADRRADRGVGHRQSHRGRGRPRRGRRCGAGWHRADARPGASPEIASVQRR